MAEERKISLEDLQDLDVQVQDNFSLFSHLYHLFSYDSVAKYIFKFF